MGSFVTASIDPQHARVQSAAVVVSRSREVQPETTTIEVASARLGIGRSLGYQLTREGRFPVPVIRCGRRMVIAALERLLNGEPSDRAA